MNEQLLIDVNFLNESLNFNLLVEINEIKFNTINIKFNH